jgi:hypothetical protein
VAVAAHSVRHDDVDRRGHRANTAEGQAALELLRRLRNIQQAAEEAMPVVVPPLEAFEIVG